MQPVEDIWMRMAVMFALAFTLGGLCGMAWLLRSKDPMPTRAICSSVLNGGLCSAVVAMIWLNTYQDNVAALLGFCGTAGLGGTPTVEFLSGLFRKVTVRIIEKNFHIDLDDSQDLPPNTKGTDDVP